jgi:hypothetical protein
MHNTVPFNLSVNGNTLVDWRAGKRGIFAVAGTFDSATVKLQTKVGTTWYDLPNCSLTANGQAEFVSPSNELRLNVSGVATAATLTAVVNGVQL